MSSAPAMECPDVVALTVSAPMLRTSFDMSQVVSDCTEDLTRRDRPSTGEDPCIAYYTDEVSKVADEVRALGPLTVRFSRQPTDQLFTCHYAEPDVTTPGRINAVDIERDESGKLAIYAIYTPVLPRSSDRVCFGAYPTRVSAEGVDIAPNSASEVTDSTGPYFYAQVDMGTATMNPAPAR
jgi:hypothetical protein